MIDKVILLLNILVAVDRKRKSVRMSFKLKQEDCLKPFHLKAMLQMF